MGQNDKISSEGQDLLGHSAPFWGIVGVQVERHRNSARYFVSPISESVFKCYVYAGSSSAELPMRKGNVAGNRQWPPAGASKTPKSETWGGILERIESLQRRSFFLTEASERSFSTCAQARFW